MTATSEFRDLLERAGARPPRRERGRWTCPECWRPDLSVNLDRCVFQCFHAGCPFSGGVTTLRKRLGIASEWLPRNEYIRLRRRRELAKHAALRLDYAVTTRRFALLDSLQSFNRVEQGAQRAGPDRSEVWDALAVVYHSRLTIAAELAVLENATTADLVGFLTTDPQIRDGVLARVIERGGFFDWSDSFVEVFL